MRSSSTGSPALDFLRLRAPVFVGVALVCLTLLFGVHQRGSLQKAWEMIAVPALSPPFADTWTVTDSIDCLQAGQDPYVVRSFDPWHRVYNYPPIWLGLRYFGVSTRASNWMGVTLAIFSVVALLLLFRAGSVTTWLLCFFSTICWSLLYGVERGNIDQAIFLLLVGGFFLIERQKPEFWVAWTTLLISVLTLLKIFPVISVVVLVRNRRSVLTALAAGGIAMAALLATCGHRLAQILANTPQQAIQSYGSYVVLYTMSRHFYPSATATLDAHHNIAAVAAAVVGSMAAVAGILYGERLNRFLPELDLDRARGWIAASGLAIYCFTFWRGSSYDYRLIFLLGVVAYLVADVNVAGSLRSLPAAIVLLAFLWMPANRLLIHEVLDLAIFVAACAWLGATAWSRIKTPERRIAQVELVREI